jgi:hypothetical protein
MPELFPDVARFQSERNADRHEGEQPARVIAEKPGLSFKGAIDEPWHRLRLFIKAEKSNFEHGVHQRRLRTHGREFDPRVEELFLQHAVFRWPVVPRRVLRKLVALLGCAERVCVSWASDPPLCELFAN